MLASIDNKFSNSNLKVKIQLYLLPLLLFYFIFNLVDSYTQKSQKQEITVQNLDFVNKKFDGSLLEIANSLEKIANKLNIKILSINQKNNNLYLKGESSIEDLKIFINSIEYLNNFTNLNVFKITKIENSLNYNFELNISFAEFFIKQKQKIRKEDKKIENKTTKYILNAIIYEYVFINNKWLKLNDSIDNLKIIEITNNYVLLKNEKDQIKLELKNDNFTKYLN